MFKCRVVHRTVYIILYTLVIYRSVTVAVAMGMKS